MTSSHLIPTPLGILKAEFTEVGLRSLSLLKDKKGPPPPDLPGVGENVLLEELRCFLNGFFRQGGVVTEEIPLDMTGITPFRKKVYEELMKVGFGEVVTYGDLAHRIGCPGGARAVGNAMNSNPILLVIPCHRAVACGNGHARGLGGFGAGLDAKRFLLRLEGHGTDILDL
ncbi:MAG: MGMT family protein [Candidatus Thermoplasmatota archaeon]|nr:MGMT family protein [Candidatus Thermoplasmatota archaeon]